MQREQIALNKKKTIQYFFGAIFFTIIGLLMVAAPQYFTHSENTGFTTIIGYCCLTLFGIGVILFSTKIFNKRPGLIIDNNGITDQTSVVGIGFIPWKDIKTIYAQEISDHTFIMIGIENAQAYLQRQNNPIAKRAMEINMQLYKTPLFINVALLKTTPDLLLQKLISASQAINKI